MTHGRHHWRINLLMLVRHARTCVFLGNDLNLGNLKFVLDDSVFMYRIIPEWSLNPLSIHHQEFSTTRK
jgi:hypothetical protein